MLAMYEIESILNLNFTYRIIDLLAKHSLVLNANISHSPYEFRLELILYK